jgi:hypothetical protein
MIQTREKRLCKFQVNIPIKPCLNENLEDLWQPAYNGAKSVIKNAMSGKMRALTHVRTGMTSAAIGGRVRGGVKSLHGSVSDGYGFRTGYV